MSTIIAPLTSFSCIKISGKTVKQFLQGQVTCDIESVSEKKLCLGAYCNDKGRISASGYFFESNNDYYFFSPKSLIANTQQKFRQYGIFSNIKTEIIADMLFLYCIGKPHNINTPAEDGSVTEVSPNVRCACLNAETEQYMIFGLEKDLTPFREKIASTKDVNFILDQYHWDQANIDAGIVHIFPETLEKLTPHMINYHKKNAISFTKGCFLGQEIIARTQHRGRGKRKLYKAMISEPNNVKVGSYVNTKDGEQAGITVACSKATNDCTNILLVLADHTVKSKLYIEKFLIEGLDLLLSPETA